MAARPTVVASPHAVAGRDEHRDVRDIVEPDAVPGCSNDRRVAADTRKRRSALVDTRFVTVFFRNERQERGDRFTVDVVVYDRAISPTRDLIRVRQASCHTALAGIGERRRPIAGRLQTVEPSRQRVRYVVGGHGCEDAVADRDHTGAAATGRSATRH